MASRLPGWLLGTALTVLSSLPAAATTTLPATGSLEVAFSPWDDAEGLVLRTLAGARHSILVQAYVLTSRNIATALQEARARGVDVRILADREQMERNDNSLVPFLADAGIPVRLETRYSAAHNKILVVDEGHAHPVVVTGSYNFSWSAQARNAENLMVLRDNPRLARLYRDNWLRHWQEAEPLVSTGGDAGAVAPGTGASRRGRGDATLCPWLTPQERRVMEGCRAR
ncbi:hypothetical protein DLREEDagrD3_20160 [Denitratisoma sp. agr-D3]